MLYRVQACIAIASVFVALPVTAEQTKSQDNPEIYRSLSEELPSLPLPLVSQEGLPRFLESTDRNTLLFKDGSIVDQNGSFASLPDHARFKPLDGRAGLYLVEYSDGTQPVLRLAHVKEATMVLSPTLPNTYAPGSLTPLPDGSVAAITGGRHGSTSIIFDAYMIEGRALVPGSKSIVRRLPSGYLALSAVSHPRSGISGYVFVGESSAVIAFPSEPNISIHLSKGTRIFAAGQKHLRAPRRMRL